MKRLILCSLLLCLSGCHSYQRLVIKRMYQHRPVCPDCAKIQHRLDKARPEGQRDETQYIKPVATEDVGPAV